MAFRPALIAASALLAACTSVAADQRSLDGTRWQVIAIDGRATPGGEMYFMQFDGGQIGGRFGCNQFGGSYAVRGGQLTTSDVFSTLIGCPEPAATFEAEGMAVLNQPMAVGWQSDAQLTLSNSAGSIQLTRS